MMGLFSKKAKEPVQHTLNWVSIQTIEELQNAYASTEETPGLFFKHSTHCGISKMALNRFQNNWKEDEKCNLFYIDLLQFREVSNKLSELSQINHQSPQAILVDNRKVLYNASHSGIDTNEIVQILNR